MNYANEKFPEDMSMLIQKCEKAIITIKQRFLDTNCLIVKDLYHPESGRRQSDFIQKLQVSYCSRLGKKSKKDDEVKGLYVFGEIDILGNIEPIYVGISRTIFRRLRQHAWGKKHNETSFSYLKAKHFSDYKGKRELLSIDLLTEQQEKIKNYRLIIIPELDNYDLYFMEVYIAGRLKTKWNSFKTH